MGEAFEVILLVNATMILSAFILWVAEKSLVTLRLRTQYRLRLGLATAALCSSIVPILIFPTDSNLAVEVSNLERTFHGKKALRDVNLKIPRGTIQGLVGLNGAGKTTLIRHLIGSLKAQSGEVRVLGHDPVRDPEGVLKQIGYMTEEDSLPKWMRVGELIDFCRGIYPTWGHINITFTSLCNQCAKTKLRCSYNHHPLAT